ncbi:DUF4105 domain-containing protein [Corallococcus sp. AB049A]|uniref:Lnb N-terminal periplasmic domain-containing protein n=1 Tax=Corallococcus sp. AB049A TaxID=2316721 RepID=UPI000ED498D7|nr:DUF4105 domain-containing protein [Corallococcus sp. AB049A]RKI66654.1 DUF4105 domain-containing protein [Corallococcus sp. AB049A]
MRPRPAWVAGLAVLLLPALARAEDAPGQLAVPTFLKEASETALATRVAALEATAGIVLRGDAARDAWLVTDVEAGLEALPPAMRRPPGGRLEFVLHPEPAPLGLGDGTKARPDWSEQREQFHLYRYAPSEERRATLRLSRLTDTESAHLWRRRAVVHAVMQRWDDARGWSKRPQWRRLDGWLLPFERPLTWKESASITYAGAFSRARGQVSASLDFVTFAEELFVPVESLRPDALPVDDQVRCQEFSKARALSEFITEARLGTLPAKGGCPAFDAWAEADALSHLEVLLVAASGRQPQSLFGHLLLRPVWREGARVQGPGFERVVQLVALTGMEEKGLGYLMKGMTGGYNTVFLTGTLGDITHESLELEQRTIRRFRLNLTPGESQRMLERIWELERRGYLGYYFFTDNCAAALLFLLNGSLENGRHVSAPGMLWVLPTATLDTLAKTNVVDAKGGTVPLLEHVPDAFESTGDRARRARVEQERLLTKLATLLPSRALEPLHHVHRQLQSPEPGVRRQAYAQLPHAVTTALDARADTREALHAYVAHAVRVERAAVDQAEAEKLAIERERLVAVELKGAGGAAQGVKDRQRLFEREDAMQRKLAVLDRTALLQQALDTATKRLPTPDELKALVRAEHTEAAFAAATEAQGTLNDGPFADVDPRVFLAKDHEQKKEAETTWARGALRESGAARMVVSGGVDFPEVGAARPVVSLRTSAMNESLGDARLHGFQSSSELRVLDGELSVEPRWGVPRIIGSRLTLVGYRTLLPELPQQQRSLSDSLGWGAEARMSTDIDRPLPYRATVEAEALGVVAASERFDTFLAVGLGAQATMAWTRGETVPHVGPRLSLAHRTGLPGPGNSALRLEATYVPSWRMGITPGFTHEADATLQVEWYLGRVARWSVLLTPRAQVHWEGTLASWAGPGRSLASLPEGLARHRLALGVELR